MLAAEDTRTLRHLMEIHGLPLNGRPLVAYHDHNEAAVLPRLMAALRAALATQIDASATALVGWGGLMQRWPGLPLA